MLGDGAGLTGLEEGCRDQTETPDSPTVKKRTGLKICETSERPSKGPTLT